MSPKPLDLTGQRFGMLTALTRTAEKENRYYLWECVCDYGGKISTSTKKLQRGTITNCGCLPKATAQNGSIPENVSGQRFGLLTAIRKEESRGGKTQWLCVCDCGNIVDATADSLMNGRVVSCGCGKQEIKYSVRDNLTFVDGTCIGWLRSRKHICDNTSGFRGVYKAKNKWRASIGLKGERYHIGTFNSFKEAKEARLEVEKIIHDDFVLAWDKWIRFATSDPDWAASNPFVFDVNKVDGEIVVHAPILNNYDRHKP